MKDSITLGEIKEAIYKKYEDDIKAISEKQNLILEKCECLERRITNIKQFFIFIGIMYLIISGIFELIYK